MAIVPLLDESEPDVTMILFTRDRNESAARPLSKDEIVEQTTLKRQHSPETGMRLSSRWIVRHARTSYPHMCDYFMRKHGFSDLCRLVEDLAPKSKASHFRDILIDLIYVCRNLRRMRGAQEIVAIGFMAFNVALLLKLGLLPSCRRVHWFGLFIHSPSWLRFLRPAFRFLDSDKIQYVLFSNFEKPLYAKSLLLDESKMYYVPYGDMSEKKKVLVPVEVEINVAKQLCEGAFFFSGGYSNRDYLSLIAVFSSLPYKLVIVCSALNTEIDESIVPANIKVLREISSESFDCYVKASKACIMPIAHDTGAAGQSVLLRYMENKKVIIATDTGIIREYVTDGVSGILVKNNREAMATAVRSVDANIDSYGRYADAAYERYLQCFSGEATARRLDEMLDRSGEGHGEGYGPKAVQQLCPSTTQRNPS